MHKPGLLYVNGQGVPKDLAEADEWLEKAAAKDDAGAMLSPGMPHPGLCVQPRGAAPRLGLPKAPR
jgi:TPR repeat protein